MRPVRLVAPCAALVLLLLAGIAANIVIVAGQSAPGPADAAIVLGAAVAGGEPSPVFAERLRHAVELYRSGRVDHLVLTGGVGAGDRVAESEAGRLWALAAGVPAEAILTETRSHTTQQNFAEAAPIMAAAGIETMLVVSDPLHLQRALRMARDLGLDAAPSPTPTSRYRSLATQAPMLASEIGFTLFYLLTGR